MERFEIGVNMSTKQVVWYLNQPLNWKQAAGAFLLGSSGSAKYPAAAQGGGRFYRGQHTKEAYTAAVARAQAY